MTAKAETPEEIPVFRESIGSALIDSARISVMAALMLLPPRAAESRIILASDPDYQPPEASPHGCLEQAMEWLDAARVHTIEAGAPVTSLHVAGSEGEPG